MKPDPFAQPSPESPTEKAIPAVVKKCSSCGREITTDLMFCPKCGGEVCLEEAPAANSSEAPERTEDPPAARVDEEALPLSDSRIAAPEGKAKKISAKAIVLSAAIVLVVAMAAGGLLAHNNKAETYETAMQMYDSWQIEEARALFSDLGDFRDSQAMVEECDDILKQLTEVERKLNSDDPDTVAQGWVKLSENKDNPLYAALAREHGGFPDFYNISLLWETSDRYGSYLEDNEPYGLSLRMSKDPDGRYYPYVYLEINDMNNTSLGWLASAAGFGAQTGEGVAYQQYAYSGNRDLQYKYTYIYGTCTLGGEEALWIAVAECEDGEDAGSSGLIGCVQLQGRSADEVVSLFAIHCEYTSLHGLNESYIFEESVCRKSAESEAELASNPRLIEYGSKPAPSTSSENKTSSSSTTDNGLKDQLITDTSGKQVYRVHAYSSTLNFTGSYQGSGNFIVKVLDSNQDLEELVCNEIGDWTIDKSVSVTPGKMYYIQVEWSRGTWNMQWTGTGGA